jgi:hypothetical protein
MTGMISVIPSKQLDAINTTAVNHVFQQLEPMSRRVDTISPSNGSGGVNTDAFLYQTGKSFLNLRQLKRDIFQINFTCNTNWFDQPPQGVNAATPSVLNEYNWTMDNFCLSKAINEIVLKWGSSELKEVSETRTPFLTEVKTSFLDEDACHRYGQSPLAFDGYGDLNNIISYGPVERSVLAGMTNAQLYGNFLYPLFLPDVARDAEATKIIKNAKDTGRIKLLTTGQYAPLAKKQTDASFSASTLVLEQDGLGGWYPTQSVGGANWYDITDFQIYVEVQEYLIADFLTTPYSKNKTERMIKTSPNVYINLQYKYNTDYIANSIFKIVDAGANVSNVSCSRVPSESRVTLESFDVYNPPQNDVVLQYVKWTPERVDCAVSPALVDNGIATGASNATYTFKTINQTSNKIPPYLLLAADSSLWNGLSNPAVRLSRLANFNPALITDCKLKIGQTTVTENIPISELIKMTIDLINNNEHISDIIGVRKECLRYLTNGYEFSLKGFPFLLIDMNKLNMENSQYGQYMSNVSYPTVQSLDIQYTIATQSFGVLNGVTPVPSPLNYYPMIYKFYPKGVYQYAGKDVEEIDIEMTYAESIEALQRDYSNKRNIDLDMITGGSGWFENISDYLKKNAKQLAQTFLKGVRLGEKALRDSEYNDTMTYKALSGIDKMAASVGLGQKGKMMMHSKKKGMALR